MKIKIKLLAVIQIALIAFGISYANVSIAAACADNTSPTANCTNLVINSNAGVLVNNYSIDSTSNYAVRLISPGTFSLFTNNGIITSGSVSGFSVGGDAGNLVNNGTFNGSGGGITIQGSLNSLTNTGSITPTSGSGIRILSGSIDSIINSGVIGSGSAYGIGNSGTIGTITNTGRISGAVEGIQNAGTIGTLNNSSGSLFYSGKLPGTYNVIINSPTDYGQIRLQLGGTGTMNFGIDSSSTIPLNTTTYGSVLNGFSAANINTATTTGAFVGGLVTTSWILNNSSGSIWNLQTTKTVAAAPVVAGSSAGTNLAYVFAGQAANTAVQSNGVTIGSAVSGLTQTQVNQLQNVHAEGYSSNMTIGLEQMAHITNTVMDRIHAPMSSSPSTKVYQDDEGRYVWADAAAVKGTVNNYNNLAGFGYNLYDVIFGADIKRSKDGGFGVFAGTGSTSMTESQQVTQNFNTTNFYAGLYGALNFAEQVKLSGALGYMYGSTNANRSTSNVGDLVGGNATSSFKSNGVYAAAKLAKAYQAESFTVSPFVGASYSQLWMGGASEQGGNTFNYGINSATAYTAVTFAGADFIYPLLKGTNDPLSLIGFYKFGYDWYANSASAHTVNATTSFNGSTQSFAQVGANMGPVSNMVGLGIQGGITKEISARIGAVASYNTYGHEYGGGAELRFKF